MPRSPHKTKMEPGTGGRLSARGRRAVALMTISLLAIAVTSLAWIAPGLHLGGIASLRTAAATPSLPPGYDTSYAFVNRSIGWAQVRWPAGGSTLFKTEDGGKHWRRLTILVGNLVGTLQFVDTTHGFVLTTHPDQLYRTTDGGASWVPVAIPAGSTNGLTFADARHGWSVVQPVNSSQVHAMYATADGGDTWGHLSDLPKGSSGLAFRGSEAWLNASGYEVGRLHVYASFDGGLSWQSRALPRPPGSIVDPAYPPIFFAQPSLLPGGGVVAMVATGPDCQGIPPCTGYDEAEFTSFDGGGTWNYVARPPSDYQDIGYQGIGYQDATHWWAATASGTLFKSSDAGQTWKQVSSHLPAGVYTFHFVDSQHAWAQVDTPFVRSDPPNIVRGAVSTLLSTTDGGIHWTKVATPQLR